MKTKLILASQSPRRKELLSHLGLPFEIKPATKDEISDKTDPGEKAIELAVQKAEEVSEHYRDGSVCVIGADTLVWLNGEYFEKPKDRGDAKRILSTLSDNTHIVCTGVCILLLENGVITKRDEFFVQTKVSFEKITETLLEKYLDCDEPYDKAGAYGIQGAALSFISKIDGSYSNVVGFPLAEVYSRLQNFVTL